MPGIGALTSMWICLVYPASYPELTGLIVLPFGNESEGRRSFSSITEIC